MIENNIISTRTYSTERRRNAAWLAKFRESLDASASAESDDWLRFVTQDDARHIALASLCADPHESKRRIDEVLARIWERCASAAADAYAEQLYGW